MQDARDLLLLDLGKNVKFKLLSRYLLSLPVLNGLWYWGGLVLKTLFFTP